MKYNPSYHTTWRILEAKPNFENVSSEFNGVLESFYFEPFQIHLKTTENLESYYFKVFSFVQWQDTPIPENAQSITADQTQTTKLINTLDTNNGKSTHIDVHFIRSSLTGDSTASVGRWHQKEIYYITIPIGTNQSENKYILQRVSDIPLNTSLYDGNISLNDYMLEHHNTIHDTNLLKIKQMYTTSGTNSVSHQSLYGTTERNGYDNPTEKSVIENMKKTFESESYVELPVGTQLVYLAPERKSRNTTITCDTYEKSPTSADIEPIASSSSSPPPAGSPSPPPTGSSPPPTGSSPPAPPTDGSSPPAPESGSLTSCQNINKQNIHYESTSHSGKDRRFMLNVSITSLFAAISFLKPNFVTIYKDKTEWNLFSIIVVFQMFMFLYVSTGFYTDSKTEAYFWVSILFSFFMTFFSYFYHKKNLKEKQIYSVAITKSLSSFFSISFNLLLLCHLIVQLSSGTSSDPTYSTERVTDWFIAAFVFLALFLVVPFDDEPFDEKGLFYNYRSKLLKTFPVRLLILFLFIICTSIFTNNYLDIPRAVRLIFTIVLSIMLVFLTLPRFETVFDGNEDSYSEYKASTIVSIILSVFFSVNNFSQSFSNYATESGNQYIANVSNLYNASSALSVSMVSLITAQLVFGKSVFYPMAIMCSIPFLTLYQYEAVKESATDVCAVKVKFGEDATGSTMMYNSKDCGNGSIFRPDPDCRFSKQKVFQVQMLDKNNNCQVLLHENIGENSQKTVWSLKNNSLKFNENCSSNDNNENSCLRTSSSRKSFNPTTAHSVTVLQRCQIKVYPAGRVDPDSNTVTPPGYHLRIREDKLGVKGLKFAEHFEAWVDNEDAEGQITSTRAVDTDSMYNPDVWKDLRVDRVVITGSDFNVLGYENTNATGLGLNWIYVGTTLPSITSTAATGGAGGATGGATGGAGGTTGGGTTGGATGGGATGGAEANGSTGYEELRNPQLSSALASKTVFTAEEWSTFNVTQPVTQYTYVKIGSKFYLPNNSFIGSRQAFTSGTNEISPPTNFQSFVIENYLQPVWPEVLPFKVTSSNSEYLNIMWRVMFYGCLFLIPVLGFSKGFKSEQGIFLSSFFVSMLIGIISKNGIYNRGMGLGGAGLTGSEEDAMDPNVFVVLFTICIIFALSVQQSFFTTGSLRAGLLLGSLLFGNIFIVSDSILPILVCFGIIGSSLSLGLKGRDMILALSLPILAFIAIVTAWGLGKGTLPCGDKGDGSLQNANGEVEYGNCNTPTGNFWEDIWNENSHFFLSIGYRLKDFFTGVTFEKISNEFEKVVAKLEDDNINSFCNAQDSDNPLCVASRRNKCTFSYCISPPDPIRMDGFDDSYNDVENIKMSRCKSHKLFHKSAMKAISENKATAKQKYCVNYHKNDDCSNVCKDYWKNDSDPVSRESLAKLESRLKVIDDSILEISPEEWVQMKKEDLDV
jgi:hypothetical protein